MKIDRLKKNMITGFIAILLTAVGLLSGASSAHAYGANECPAERHGSSLGCTANDVSITNITVAPNSPTACVGGQSVTLDLDVTVQFNQPNRYDIGVYFSNDGTDPSELPASGTRTCSVSALPIPPDSDQFLDLDGEKNGTPTGDFCGDGNKNMNGGSGAGHLYMPSVQVACKAVPLSGGRLFLPFVTSWDQTASPSGDLCTKEEDLAPGTQSKCNVPDGTVETDVLSSTVSLVVLPTISKTDGLTTVTAGDTTTYSVVITNTTGAPLSNAIFQDPAVANLTIDSLVCSAAGGATCPASLPINTMQGGGIIIPPMPVNSSVTFTIGATVSASAPAGTLTNTALVTVDAETNSAEDTNNVITKLVVSKSFDPPSISANGETALTITLQNTNLTDATDVAFTDTYPADLFNAADPAVTNTCGGSVTAAGGGSSLALSGGTIPAGGSCTITAKVTSAVGGVYDNSTGAVTSAEGYVGDSASASLAVSVSNLSTSTKSWQDLNGGEPDPGDAIRYTITIKETAGVEATNVSLSDTVSNDLAGLTVFSCPAGATCGFSGQTLSATSITVPANGFVSVVFDATIPMGTAAGTTINNCASISNPGGIGASPCASTIIVSPSAIAGAGNKLLYLHDSAASYKLSRSKPAGAQNSVTVSQSSSQQWTLSPALASPVTISPDVTPLAIIPVNLYLASDVANQSRSVQVDVTCSGGGPTYSESKIFDGTAVNNPYLPTTPTLVSFNNLTVSGDHFCGTGQTWNLTVNNTGTGSLIVHPTTSGGNNSFISLPSLNIINVDSVTGYDAAYSATTTPANGYFSGGQAVYLRAVVSDPFGSFDITSAVITIENTYGTAVVTDVAMTEVADSGTLTKTYEYAYTLPTSGPAGSWTVTVTAEEGNEGTISDDGAGAFELGIPNLTIVKSANKGNAQSGEIITYTVQIINTGNGAGTNVVLTDKMSPYIAWGLDSFGAGQAFQFTEGNPASGLTLGTPDYSQDGGSTWGATPTSGGGGMPAGYDGTITNWQIPMSGEIAPGGQFTLRYKTRVK